MNKSLRILVVEDDAAMQTVLWRTFRRNFPGSELYWTDSVADAKAFLQEAKPFDLVLADLYLGDELGTAVWDYCREHCPSTAFAFLSGADVLDFIRAMGSTPMPAFLPKPFRPQEITGLVQGLVRTSARAA